MNFIAHILRVTANYTENSYKISPRNYPGLSISFEGKKDLVVNANPGKVKFTSSDKDRYFMFVDGEQICRDGDNMSECKQNDKNNSSGKVFIEKVGGKIHRIKWGTLGLLANTFKGKQCLEYKPSKGIAKMKDCEKNNSNQDWIFEPEEKKRNEPEPEIKNDKENPKEDLDKDPNEKKDDKDKKPNCAEICKNKKKNCANICKNNNPKPENKQHPFGELVSSKRIIRAPPGKTFTPEGHMYEYVVGENVNCKPSVKPVAACLR